MEYCSFPTGKPQGEMAERLAKISYVITDLDGTMLTGAKATVDSSGRPSTELIEVLVELERAGIEVVPCSGRNRSMIFEDARILGLHSWIAEMGGLICTKSGSQPEWTYYTGDMPYNPDSWKTPHDLICETGVIDEILEHWRSHMECYHDNYIGFEYREVTVAMRGDADPADVQVFLDHSGLPLYMADNGYVRRINGSTTLENVDMKHPQGIHTYHIMPKGLTKGTGIRRYAELRNISPDEMIACGDSPADCEMADYVGSFLFMRNGLDHPLAEKELAAHNNIWVSNLPSTDGWCDAMRTLLAAHE